MKTETARLEDVKPYLDKDAIFIDEIKLHIPEFLEIPYALFFHRFKNFFISGGRFTGKSYFVALFWIFLMLKYPKENFICVMWDKVDHDERTMNQWEEGLDKINEKWPGFRGLWTCKKGQSHKEWVLTRGKNVQKIEFVGENDIDKGTIMPASSKGIFGGIWWEEPTGTQERGGIDNDKMRAMEDKINRLKGSLIRFWNRLNEKEQKLYPSFHTLISFNPYNKDNHLIERYIQNHDNNLSIEKLEATGWQSSLNFELKEMYVSTNAKVNPFLPAEALEFLETLKKTNYDLWLTDGLGKAGQTSESIYGDIFPLIEKRNKDINEIKYINDPNNYGTFIIGIDIGMGGIGETTVSLIGKRLHPLKGISEQWDGLETNGWNGKPFKNAGKRDLTPDFLVREIFFEIKKWENKYRKMSSKLVEIKLDRDVNFEQIFVDGYKKFKLETGGLKTIFNVTKMGEKYHDWYSNPVRAQIFKTLFTRNMFNIWNKGSSRKPDAHFIQWRTAQYEKDKFINIRGRQWPKVKDGDDDRRQATEIAMSVIAKRLLQNSPNSWFDKNIIDLLKIN